MEDIIIIGAGPIGLYAAHLAALHNLKGIVLEARDNFGGQLTNLYPDKDIVDVPGFERITARDLIKTLHSQMMARENHLDLHLLESVQNIVPLDGGYKVVSTLETYETKTILIVSGMGNFTPRKVGLENEDQFENIAYAIKDKNAYKDKNVVLLGGGDSAVDWDLMLEPLAKDISIVHRREEFRAQSSSVEAMKKTKTHIYTPYNTTKLIGEGKTLKAIEITNNVTSEVKVLPLDVLIVNFGMVIGQNNFPLEKKGTNIIIHDCYETSLPSVFAIGNTIAYQGKVKNITCGFGEAVVAITKIDQIINPGKNIPVHF